MIPILKRREERPGLTLVLGATGKFGRRVAAALASNEVAVRLVREAAADSAWRAVA